MFGQALESNSLSLPPDRALPAQLLRMYHLSLLAMRSSHSSKTRCAHILGEMCLRPKLCIINYRLSRARRVIEKTFGILASRWRIFRRPIIATPEYVVAYTKAAIALHNFLRKTGSTYCPVGFVDFEDNNGNISEGAWCEEATAQGLGPIHILGSIRHSSTAASIRDAFKDYFSSPAGEVQWKNQCVHHTC